MIAELHELAGRLDPISLAAVDRDAALQLRTDSKYVVDLDTFGFLAALLARRYDALEIDGDRVFSYDTVYFDTPELLTYHQHVQRRRRRFKCRTRLYAASGLCYFEAKLKTGRGETVKRRLAIDPPDHGSLTEPAHVFLDGVLRREYKFPAPADLAPVLRTTYSRITLASRSGAERLTCDFDLAFETRDGEHCILPERVLLETKSRAGNARADRLLRRLGVQSVGSCSKYCLGVALAYPSLPDNEFRRLLRGHFDPARYARPLAPAFVPEPEPALEPELLRRPGWSPRGDVAPEAIPA